MMAPYPPRRLGSRCPFTERRIRELEAEVDALRSATDQCAKNISKLTVERDQARDLCEEYAKVEEKMMVLWNSIVGSRRSINGWMLWIDDVLAPAILSFPNLTERKR
jgi:hypothetical protein